MSQNKKNVWIHGISGRMGQTLTKTLETSPHFQLQGGSDKDSPNQLTDFVDNLDLIIDFSSKEGNEDLFQKIVALAPQNLSVLICSTGLSEQQLKNWSKLGETLKILEAPNTSLGILALGKAAKQLAPLFQSQGFDIQLQETHHRYKKDAPSGTALHLAKEVASQTKQSIQPMNSLTWKNNEIAIQVTRGGGVFGEHQIRFLGDHEELTLSHRAFSRDLFSKGALTLGSWVLKQKPGFYNLQQVSLQEL